MRWAVAIGLGLCLALASVALPPGARAYHEDGGDSVEAVSGLRSVSGQSVRGLARLSAHRDGPAQAQAVVMGLPDEAESLRLGLSKRSCNQLGKGQRDINDIYILKADFEFSGNGTAYSQTGEGQILGNLLYNVANVRSVVIVGDWDGDGSDGVGIGACGPLVKHAVDWSETGGDNLFGVSDHVGDGSDGARFLAYLTAGEDVPNQISTAAIGLDPDTRYRLGVTNRNCNAIVGQPGFPVVLTSFTTDSSGSALQDGSLIEHADIRSVAGGSDPGSLVIARAERKRLDIAACGPLSLGISDRTHNNDVG